MLISRFDLVSMHELNCLIRFFHCILKLKKNYVWLDPPYEGVRRQPDQVQPWFSKKKKFSMLNTEEPRIHFHTPLLLFPLLMAAEPRKGEGWPRLGGGGIHFYLGRRPLLPF